MPTPVTMPQLGESVTEGTVVKWLKQEGDAVERDEPLFEVTTDKVNAEMPSPFAGVLLRRVVDEGAVVPIGALVAEILEPGETGDVPIAAEPATAMSVYESNGATKQADSAGEEAHPAAEENERRRYSPVVRKLASEHGIDLHGLTGTGLGGRVTKDDVLAYLARGVATTASAGVAGQPDGATDRVTRDMVLEYINGFTPSRPASGGDQGSTPALVSREQTGAPVPSSSITGQPSAPIDARSETTLQPGETSVPLTAMRRSIAEHMVRSKTTAPHATTVTEVDMTALVRWREANKESFRERHGVEITYITFVTHAVLGALRRFPLLNSSWGGDKIVVKRQLNIGIAVGLEDGLLVPVIHGADEKSLIGLARAVAELAGRARSGKLTLNDLQGGTFTVNNTGVFGSIVSTPVINQPQAAILSMEAIVKRPVVVADAIAIRSMMNICLSFDHRIVDGLMAGRFNQAVRGTLEQASAVTQA